MTPGLQTALSVKFAAPAVVIIPTPEGYFMFSAFGTDTNGGRSLIGTFTLEELGAWFESELRHVMARHEAEKTAIAADPLAGLDFTL